MGRPSGVWVAIPETPGPLDASRGPGPVDAPPGPANETHRRKHTGARRHSPSACVMTPNSERACSHAPKATVDDGRGAAPGPNEAPPPPPGPNDGAPAPGPKDGPPTEVRTPGPNEAAPGPNEAPAAAPGPNEAPGPNDAAPAGPPFMAAARCTHDHQNFNAVHGAHNTTATNTRGEKGIEEEEEEGGGTSAIGRGDRGHGRSSHNREVGHQIVDLRRKPGRPK